MLPEIQNAILSSWQQVGHVYTAGVALILGAAIVALAITKARYL